MGGGHRQAFSAVSEALTGFQQNTVRSHTGAPGLQMGQVWDSLDGGWPASASLTALYSLQSSFPLSTEKQCTT